MLITHESAVPREGVEKMYGFFPFTYLLLGAVALAAALFPLYVLSAEWRTIQWYGWGLIALFLTPALLLWLFVARLSWHGFFSCFRGTNWVAKLTAEGLWLKFRSHLNWNAPGREHEPTVVFIPYSAIRQAHLVREHSYIRVRNTRRLRRLAYVELLLDQGMDTSPLRRAVIEEIAWKPDKKRGVGKFEEAPVYVHAPDRLRVTHRPGLLEALGQKTSLGELEFVEYHSEGPRDRAATEACALDMALRGDKPGAYSLAQFDLGLPYREASALVDQLLLQEARARR